MPTMKIVNDGVALTSADHPVTVKLTESLHEKVDVNPESLTTTLVDIPEHFIPTLEERKAKEKPLYLWNLVKIEGIVHMWMGDGFVAEKYLNNLVFNVQKGD